MKSDIHPNYKLIDVICGCGNTFQTRSASRSNTMRLEVCSKCHPFYTGQHRLVGAAGGRLEDFMRKYGNYKRNDNA